MADMSYEALRRAYEQSQSRCKDLENENRSLRQQLSVCERRNENLAERLAKITHEHNRMRGIIENKTIPMREKLTLYGACRVLEQKQSREDGFTHVYRSDIAEVTGLSESQVGDGLKGLEKKEVLDRKIEHKRDKVTGKHEKVNLIALGYAAKHNPRAIIFSDDNNWGGKREKGTGNACGCGCSEKIVKRKVICANCGCILDETEKRVGENEELTLESDEEVF